MGPVTAISLGGVDGDNSAILKNTLSPIPSGFFGSQTSPYYDAGSSFTGFGHNRLENNSNSIGIGSTPGNATGELYALIKNAAKIEISAAAQARGLRLTPDQTVTAFANEADQLLAENGVLITQGSSSTALNNVFVNLHQSLVVEESNPVGFGSLTGTNGIYKAQKVVATGNTFQYDEPRNSEIRADVSSPSSPGGNPGLSTDVGTGPSNVNGGNTDFNFIAPTAVGVLEYPAGNRMLPATNSLIIDNAIDSLVEREAFANLKLSVGIPVSNILAPIRDNSGQLRADDPDVSNTGGIGQNVFKDRGALDRADFVGPIANLGMLTTTLTADLTNPVAWTKSATPVFGPTAANGTYGVGHNSFFQTPDGKENWIVYHANPQAGLGCSDRRSIRMQPFTWKADGSPDFGQPSALTALLKRPSGE